MADGKNGNGAAADAGKGAPAPVQAQVLGQYIRDLSFENPNIDKMMGGLQGIPDQALEPFLLVNCPSILFPFLRRLLADITREGGFPPLLLDPIDFAGLYIRRQQEQAEAAGGKATA